MSKPTKSCSLCKSCDYLEAWPKLFGGSRFVCFESSGSKPVGFKDKYGRDTSKGFPEVTKCKFYKPGEHYSVKSIKLRLNKN